MRKRVKKKVVAVVMAGVMILGICPTCLAAGSVTKEIDKVKVTVQSSISGAKASGSTDSTELGIKTITLKYRYKLSESMTLKDGSKTATSGGVYYFSTSATPTDAEKMYEVSGTHTFTAKGVKMSIYT